KTGNEKGTVRLRHPEQRPGYVYFYQLYASPNGKHVATLDQHFGPEGKTRLALWDAVTGGALSEGFLPSKEARCALSWDGSKVALPIDRGLAWTDVNTGAVSFHIPDVSETGPMASSPDGRLLAAQRGKDSSEIGVWEVATGREIAKVTTGLTNHIALA